MSNTLHVLGFPHTQTDGTYSTCAYTARVIKFCRMMYGGDRKIVLYSGEHNIAPVDEHVVVVTDEQQARWFAPHDENDLNRGGFTGPGAWDQNQPWWLEMNARAIGEIRERMDKTDLLCLSQGLSQKLVADMLPELIVAEIMVGYRGILTDRKPSPAFAAFESCSHRAMVYGEKGWQNFPREGDVVIPNQFDPDELHFDADGGDYLLFVGRIIERKGLQYACAIANALGRKLVVAGPGGKQPDPHTLVGEGGVWECDDLEYVGSVGVEERDRLMGGAACVLMPTLYAEPFGGVAVEAMMCGTPVVTTDFGAFTETVEPGVSGYRFQTLQEAVDATDRAIELNRGDVRRYALDKYSLDAIRPAYERWFGNLDLLWDEGFTKLTPRSETILA